MTDLLTDHQIETLADHWPWEYDESERALRLAEAEDWPLDDTVRALDALARDFGDEADPVAVIQAAIAHKRRERHPGFRGPS